MADAPLSAALGRVRDTALVDAIHAVQLHYARADVSFTALFNPRVRVSEGPVTVRQMAALYIYENELYAVEGTGSMVKEALENAARYFLSCQGESCGRAPLVSGTVAGFNFDIAQGVEYEIDLTRPEGDRVRNLRRNGRPLDPDQKLRIAINNYRAGGQRRLRHVPGRAGGVAFLRRNPRSDHPVLHGARQAPGRSPTTTGASCRRKPPERSKPTPPRRLMAGEGIEVYAAIEGIHAFAALEEIHHRVSQGRGGSFIEHLSRHRRRPPG